MKIFGVINIIVRDKISTERVVFIVVFAELISDCILESTNKM